MGLGFHIGQGGIDNLGEYLGQIEMEEHDWLQRNGFLTVGKTGHLPDPIESLPYFDDVVLTQDQVKSVKNRFDIRKEEVFKTPGFKSAAVDKLNDILTNAVNKKQGISTCAD
ncbi:MAG: hypothetical protein HRT69_16700 [Flavobacteriaceae bacterium]|nr:hypothetical protein [Flavobacteriaceae bacterium]